ncbi:uncharacterized protein LOC130735927 [Lotus japonicus]|uniref:uncharacterized protein LOC130735927 n=1 Tax=Lotus japonicus TaxID=34305 RepID=UPI0025874309|nr:uncharacterized protein LOC130735927 [Lotus japonicus]
MTGGEAAGEESNLQGKGAKHICNEEEENGFIGLVGTWGDHDCVVVNVYSPCSLEEKRQLWDELLTWKRQSSIACWCLLGDFNAVRSAEERVGVLANTNAYVWETAQFNEFIHDMELFDISLHGRKFTWLRPNGHARSRLDRFLVSDSWMGTWPNCSQLVLDRTVSDHCPVLMRRIFQNWGPKLFRVLNCWLEDPRFPRHVERVWSELAVQGWSAGHILKEKLKSLRGNLKQWNQEVFGDLRDKRNAAVQKLNELDLKEEQLGLTPDEIIQRSSLLLEFWTVVKLHESLLCQKSRSKWVKEGDQNSKFFHSTINWRRKTNSVVGLLIDGHWEEDPDVVKSEVKRFFETYNGAKS